MLAAAQDIYDFETRSSKKGFLSSKSSSHSITQVTNKGARLAAAGNLDIIAETGDLTTAGTTFASASGDINLSAAKGDIHAGAYTDIFKEETKKSRSFLFGLISSSSSRTTTDRFNTGTDALAALDLKLVSGDDTTLIGANLAAGRNLNINTGGDFSVKAAIDSQRSDFFSSNTGLVTMTTITERSFVETAVFTKLLAGQALSLSVAGEASLELYRQAGVDQPVLEDLYPQGLLTLQGLQLLNQDLANEYFYDKQTQLSPAFKALVAVALSFTGVGAAAASALGVPAAMATGVASFVNSAIIGSLDGIVSGNFDIGDILKDATFSGVTAGLTAGINLDTFIGDIAKDSVLNKALIAGLGGTSPKLTLAGILNGAIDGAISSGLSSAVYGTDFMEGFSASMVRTMVNLTLADVQYEIGELGIVRDANGNIIKTNTAWEGSVAHALLHGIAGCAAGAALNGGQGCAAGAAAGVVQSLVAAGARYSEPKPANYATDADYRADHARWYEATGKLVELIGGLAGFAFSGGDGANVNFAAAIAVSGLENNYLSHTELALFEAELRACIAEARDCMPVVNAYKELSRLHDAELAACGSDQACITRHLTIIAAAEVSGKYEDVRRLMQDIIGPNGYVATFDRLQYETAERMATDATFAQAWQAAGAQFRSEFVKMNCGSVSQATCETAFSSELNRIAADQKMRAQNAEALINFFKGIGVAIEFVPGVGDVIGVVECASTMTASSCVAAAAGLIPIAGDAVKLAMRKGDDIVDVTVRRADDGKVLVDEAPNAGAGGFYDPRAWRQNYEDFYSGNVTSTTVPPYSAKNVQLAGQSHPETGVVFDQRGFPIFDNHTAYDTRFTGTDFSSASYQTQMRMATRDLRTTLETNPKLRSQFRPDQLQAIQSGNAKIPDYTWHHHQDSGRMQLVDQTVHRETGHIGGEAMSGDQ